MKKISINLSQYRQATFITDGIPYSYIFENIIPICHLLRYPNLGRKIFELIYSHYRQPASIGIVFSPPFIDIKDNETEFTIQSLEANNFIVEKLIGLLATHENFDKYVGFLPFEILHLCTHSVTLRGWHVKREFIDEDNNPHLLEYEEVISANIPSNPHPDDQVNIRSLMSFKKIDGIDWHSPKKIPGVSNEILQKWLENVSTLGKQISREKIGLVKGSNAIICDDPNQPHFANFHSIADSRMPIVFNNTCSSWVEIGSRLLFAGARAYIGTLWDINNEVAKDVGEMFYKTSFEKTLVNALWEAQKQIKPDAQKNIYIFFGCHFDKLLKPRRTIESIKRELNWGLANWHKKMTETELEDVKKNSKKAVDFLTNYLADLTI